MFLCSNPRLGGGAGSSQADKSTGARKSVPEPSAPRKVHQARRRGGEGPSDEGARLPGWLRNWRVASGAEFPSTCSMKQNER